MSTNESDSYNIFELLWGGLMVGLAAYVYHSASSFPLLPGNPVGPGTFPTLIAAILFPCGLIILLQNLAVLYKLKGRRLIRFNAGANQLVLFFLVLLVPVSNILLAEQLGFILVSILATTLLMSVMRRGKVVSSLVISVLAVVVFSWIFSEYLLVPLPEGLIFQ